MRPTTEKSSRDFLADIRALAPECREALRRVRERHYEEDVYLPLDRQTALTAAGLIEVEPGRKSAVQPDRFSTKLDAKCSVSWEVARAFDLWKLENTANPDFEDKVNLGYYDSHEDEFSADAEAHAVYMGVPKQYAAAVVERAYSDGHSSGYGEVLMHLSGLAEIFEVRK